MKKYTSWRYWRGKMQKLHLTLRPRPRQRVSVHGESPFPILPAEDLARTYGIASEPVPAEKAAFDYTVYDGGEIRASQVFNHPPRNLTLLRLHNVLCLRNGGLITEDGFLTDAVTTGNHGVRIFEQPDGSAVLSSELLPQGPVEVIDTPCLHMDVTYFENFGHLLIDGLPRLWALPHIPEKHFGLFTTIGWRRLYADELLDAASGGIRIIRGKGATLCRTLYVAIQPHILGRYVCPQAQTIWQQTGERLCNRRKMDTLRRIYFSRRRVSQRPMLGEDQVETLFHEQGFTIIHPQELSLTEQVALVQQADVLAGPFGSALHNSVFGRQDLRVFSVSPWLIATYPLIDRTAGRSFAYNLGRRLGEATSSNVADFPWEAGNLVALADSLDHFLR